jgi:hypothetical protein
MYRQAALVTVILLAGITGRSQQKTDSAVKQKPALDTTAIYNSLAKDLAGLLGDFKPHSYFEISLGFSNQVFNLQNNFINATQGKGTVVTRPGMAYYHKSGLSLSANAYAADFDKFKIYQYVISPAFDLTRSKTIAFGISYSHYFPSGDSTAKQNVPYENELYSYLTYKKGWLNPGLTVGWAGGKYTKSFYIDSIYAPRLGRKVAVKKWVPVDSKVNDFSLSATLGHEFDLGRIFSKNDVLILVPTLMLNAGSFRQSSSVNIQNDRLKLFVDRVSSKRDRVYSSNLEIQSASLLFNLEYSIGKFSFSPSWLIDYYLHETTESKFSNVFAVNLGYSF